MGGDNIVCNGGGGARTDGIGGVIGVGVEGMIKRGGGEMAAG